MHDVIAWKRGNLGFFSVLGIALSSRALCVFNCYCASFVALKQQVIVTGVIGTNNASEIHEKHESPLFSLSSSAPTKPLLSDYFRQTDDV